MLGRRDVQSPKLHCHYYYFGLAILTLFLVHPRGLEYWCVHFASWPCQRVHPGSRHLTGRRYFGSSKRWLRNFHLPKTSATRSIEQQKERQWFSPNLASFVGFPQDRSSSWTIVCCFVLCLLLDEWIWNCSERMNCPCYSTLPRRLRCSCGFDSRGSG